QAEQGEELERRHEDGVEPRDLERPVDDAGAARPELAGERAARADALHDADAGDRLLDQGRGVAPRRLQALGLRVIAPRVAPAGEAYGRQLDEDDQRALP